MYTYNVPTLIARALRSRQLASITTAFAASPAPAVKSYVRRDPSQGYALNSTSGLFRDPSELAG